MSLPYYFQFGASLKWSWHVLFIETTALHTMGISQCGGLLSSECILRWESTLFQLNCLICLLFHLVDFACLSSGVFASCSSIRSDAFIGIYRAGNFCPAPAIGDVGKVPGERACLSEWLAQLVQQRTAHPPDWWSRDPVPGIVATQPHFKQ